MLREIKRGLFLAVALVLLWATGALAQPNYAGVARDVDAKHPELLRLNTHAADGQYLCRLIAALPEPFGLLSKASGENGVEIGGVYVSHDVIVHKATGRQVDVIASAGTGSPGAPSWGPIEPHHYRPHNQYVEPAGPCGVSAPAPPVTPTPMPPAVTPQTQQLVAAIEALRAQVATLEHTLQALGASVLPSLARVEGELADAKGRDEHLAERVEAAHRSVLAAVNLGERMLATEYAGRVPFLGGSVVLRPRP